MRTMLCLHTTPPGAVRITEIGFWVDNASGPGNYEVGIYNEGGGVEPTTLVGEGSVVLKADSATGWHFQTVDIAVSPSTQYWIAVQLDDTGTATNTDVENTAGTVWADAETELLDPFPGIEDSGDGPPAIYAIYSTGDGNAGQSMPPYVL